MYILVDKSTSSADEVYDVSTIFESVKYIMSISVF